jgi:nicotinamidase-related amidase
MAMKKFFPQKGRTALVVIDIQERLAAAMDQEWLRAVVDNTQRLLQGMEILGCPSFMTEQYPRGLGETVAELGLYRQRIGVMEKMAFSCCRDTPLADELRHAGTDHVLLVGMETHVCVLQTALDLLAAGFWVHVVKDGVMSRRRENWQGGLELMREAGAVVTTTETVLFQLQETAAAETFRQISKLVK